MTPTEAAEIVEEFRTNESQHAYLATALNAFANLCTAVAVYEGFTDDENKVIELIIHSLVQQVGQGRIAPEREFELREWLGATIEQAEQARIMSEVAEAVEATRKPQMDHHVPAFANKIVEYADTIIRVGDTCARREYDLGSATIAKLLYNINRPYKHGKNS